jgi:amino acid adenylation domain-containing protein
MAGRNNVTLNTMIQALWGIVLGKYNNRRDVVFGTVVSGRPSEIPGVESMVGLFINTILVRIRYDEKTTFKELLRQVQDAAIDSEPYHYYPLAEIQSAHPLKQNLLDHILIFENYPITEQIEGMISRGSENNQSSPWELLNVDRFEQSSYDFNLVVGPGEQLQVVFSYNANVYEDGFVRKIFKHLKKVLQQVLDHAEGPAAAFTLLSEEDKEQILLEFNNTQTDYPEHKTIYQLFEEQVGQTPDGISVIGPDSKSITSKNELYNQLTYRELNKRANQLAKVLTERGVKPDNIVGIMVKHSLEMIIGILGVWKAGGAYLPIDLGNPQERILYMLENSAVDIIIFDENQYAQGKNRKGIDIFNASIYDRDITNPGIVNQPFHAAYVIYTSGSTGKPKGVIVEHRNLTNTLFHRKEEYVMDWDSSSLQLFSCSFDGFLTSFFTPIISGAKVVLLSIKGIKDMAIIKEAVVNQQVTHFISIPSLYEAIMENLTEREAASLKAVTLAGEKLLPHILEITKQKNKSLEIVNEYGVTEAAVMSTIYRHQERDKHIKIGQPIWNTKIYILDNQQRLQPIGIVGEMGIAGAGTARGYLNNPELTFEKFINYKLQINKKFLPGGPGGQFFQKAPPLAAGGKKYTGPGTWPGGFPKEPLNFWGAGTTRSRSGDFASKPVK